MSPTPSTVESDLTELRLQLDRERRMRMRLEEEKQIRSIEQMYPERLRDISQQVQLHYQHPEVSIKPTYSFILLLEKLIN